MDSNQEEKFLGFKEALRLFAGSESTLRRRIEDGSIPARQFGGKGCLIEIPYSALIDESKMKTPSSPKPTSQNKKDEDNNIIPGPKPKWRK